MISDRIELYESGTNVVGFVPGAIAAVSFGDEPGIVQLWHAAKQSATQPGYVTAINTAEYWLPKAQTAANDFVYSQSTPTTRVVAEMGRSAGEAKAIAHIFTGAIELQDTGNEAVSWLATGSTNAMRSASPFGPHPLSRAVDRAVDQAFQPASSLDPRAFNSGQFVGNAQVQGSVLVASAALPFTGFGEVGIAAEASTAIGLLEDGAEATEVFNFANGAAASLEAATPAAAIQDVAVESQLITAADETTLQQLQGAASRAATNVGPGGGPVYGTRVHTAFAGEVRGFGNSNLAVEQSYLNGKIATRGTAGSVRLDVVEGPLDDPVAIYDLKTGSATLTSARIQQIQSHIPGGSNVPVTEVRP